MRRLLARIRAMFTGRVLDARLDEEVTFHLELLVQEHVRQGMSERDARNAALRSFGGVIQMKEDHREQRSLPLAETVLHDARYGCRTLLRTPGFTLAALITLALGIGANSAVFSVVNAVLLQPLPYPGADRIVELYRHSGDLYNAHTFKRFQHFKDRLRSVQSFAAYHTTAFNLTAGDHAEYVTGIAASHEYFDVLGISLLHGRPFLPEEDVPNGPDVVVLEHALWQRMFGSDPAVIGRPVLLGDRAFTVVGVMPEGFGAVRTSDFVVPLRPGPTGPGGGFNYQIVARLAPGVTREQATAEAATAWAAYRASLPNANFGNEQAPQFLALQDSLARQVRPALMLMLGAVGMLLLIACANTANLLLARASARTREISVRAALGAGRRRIVRQLVTESLVLFLAGGLLGVALAYWAVPMLVSLTPPGYLPPAAVRVDTTVLLVTLGVSLLTGLVFGLIPALSLSRDHLVEAFKEDGTRTTSNRRSNWIRRTLVVGELAVCMLLLVGAGLLLRTFMELRSVELGFEPANVLTARTSLAGERYATAAAVNQYFERGLARLRELPGVRSAAVVSGVPIERGLNLNFDRLDTPEVETHLTDWRYATADYFGSMGIQVIAGRGLTARDDAGAPKVAVVSQRLAELFFKDGSPIGQRIQLFKQDGPIEIVGIAADVREAGLKGPVPAVMYVPVAQAGSQAVRVAHSYFQASWVIKAASIDQELVRRVRDELRALDPRQPITAFRTMDEVRGRAMATEQFQTVLLGAFAVIGLLLASAGIYGLISYSVAQRTRELGIRMALGASRGRVLGSVLRQGVALATAGVLVGTAAGALLTRTVESFVFNIDTLDPPTFAVVGLVLLLVALLASIVPAFRAVRLNPVAALRQ